MPEFRCRWRIFLAVRRGQTAVATGFLKRKVRPTRCISSVLPLLTQHPLLFSLTLHQGPSVSNKKLTVFEFSMNEPVAAASIGFVVSRFAMLREDHDEDSSGKYDVSFHCPVEMQDLLRPSVRTHAIVSLWSGFFGCRRKLVADR